MNNQMDKLLYNFRAELCMLEAWHLEGRGSASGHSKIK